MHASSRVGFGAKIIAALLMAVALAAVISIAVDATLADPNLKLSFSHYETNQNQRVAIVLVENVGRVPAKFYGYSKQIPACDLERREGSGPWQSMLLRCGTGLASHLIMPGEQIRTSQYVFGAENWRVGLRHAKPTFFDRLPGKIKPFVTFLAVASPYETAWTPEMPGFVGEHIEIGFAQPFEI